MALIGEMRVQLWNWHDTPRGNTLTGRNLSIFAQKTALI